MRKRGSHSDPSDEDGLANLKVEDGEHEVGPAIQQHDVAANHYVRAVGWWRRQPPIQFHWDRLDALLQAGRQRAAFGELLFQSRGQSVLLGQSRRKRASVVIVPAAYGIAVMIAERVRGRVIIVTVLVVSVTVAMAVAVALRESEGTRQRQHCDCAAAREEEMSSPVHGASKLNAWALRISLAVNFARRNGWRK